ncbi:MAG: type I methionyl aminopeptidase [Candidatus Pelagibacterales bacterium]|jgi:methionyl aminopeptidase
MKTIHKSEDFEGMRKAGNLAARTLDLLVDHVKPGVSSQELDRIAFNFIDSNNGFIAPLFYKGFPKSICTSLNHVICHGIPSNRVLESGDIVNIDVTVIVDGWHGDTSRMFPVGKINNKAQKLIDCTYEAMMNGIEAVSPNAHLGDIGAKIQSIAENQNYSVVRDFCGHGLGKVFHEYPNILHYGEIGEGDKIEQGMFFTVEPMINIGKYDVRMLNDGWTAVTKDKTLSAQFEHSIGVTQDGHEIFTKSPAGLDKP